ncbi:MAG: site-specific integrase [Patulibacter sp.]|nr:site-specific integrase [Patulibacter sp.]
MSTTKPTARRTRVESGIYRRADGAFEIGFRDSGGRQRWRKVDGGIRAARSALVEARAQRERGERIAADPRLRFDDAAQAWWEARVVKLRATTQSAYGASLAHLRKPNAFGGKRMSDITPTAIARFVSTQEASGLKGWTIKGQISVLSAIFTYSGRHLGLPGANPVSLLDRVERPSSADQKEKRILNGDELSRLLTAIEPEYRLIFEVAAETGGRLGEILGLTWSDISLRDQTVSFAFQLDRAGARQPLKTARSRRCLEVTPALAARLAEHKRTSGHFAGHDLVFMSRSGRGLDHRNVGGRILSRAVDRAGLAAVTDRHGSVVQTAPTFHSLRHTHASALIAAGWDIEEVSARLGHANVAITQQIYVHQFDAARRSEDRRERLSALYG